MHNTQVQTCDLLANEMLKALLSSLDARKYAKVINTIIITN